MKTVSVHVRKRFDIDKDAAQQLASDFCEWLDQVGFEIVPKNKAIADERSYEELSHEWIEEITGSKED